MSAQPLTFAAFTSGNRLRIRRDACGDPFAPGKLGHLYAHDRDWFGIVLDGADFVRDVHNTYLSINVRYPLIRS
jgi:hypothetical protein